MPDRQKPSPIFQIIEGGAKKRKVANAVLFECRVCESDLGYTTTLALKARSMPMIRSGKLIGGHDVWICATCLGRGKHTPIK